MNSSPDPVRHEVHLAGVICAIGLIWSARTWGSSYWGFSSLELTPGPLECCGVGVLLWLSAKWHLVRRRRTTAHCSALKA